MLILRLTKPPVVAAVVLMLTTVAGAQPPPGALAASRLSDQVTRTVSAAQAAGYPVSAQDILGKPPPPSENAAIAVYARWHALVTVSRLVSSLDEQMMTDASRANATPEQISAAQSVLINKREAFDVIHSASQYKSCVFEKDYSRGPLTLFSELTDMRVMTRFLMAESSILLHEGKPALAARTASIGFNISSHCAQVPGTLAAQVSYVIDSITLKQLENILTGAPDDISCRDAVQQAIADREPSERPTSALHTSLAMAIIEAGLMRISDDRLSQIVGQHDGNIIDLLNSIVVTDGDSPVGALNDEVKPASLPVMNVAPPYSSKQNYGQWVDTNELVALSFLRPVVDASVRPFDERMAAATSAVSSIAAMVVQEIQRQSKSGPSATPLAALNCEVVYNFIRQRGDDYVEARAADLKTALQLFAYRAQHGQFPDNLIEASPQPPIDPFDGRPIKYRKEDKGFVLYAVGRNHNFDGGIPAKPLPLDEAAMRYQMP